MRLRAAHLIAAALLASAAAGCRSTGDSAQPRPTESLRIGTRTDSPPFAFREKRRWQGIEPDLGRALAARLGMRPRFIPLEPTEALPALLDGKVDILMAGLAVTDERQVQIDFASPYLVSGQAALVRRTEVPLYSSTRKIQAVRTRIAVIDNSAATPIVLRYFPRAQCRSYPSLEEAMDALLRNQVDLVLHDAPALWWAARSAPGEVAVASPLFAREEIAWGFRSGSVRLRHDANQALAEWTRDGTLESILRRWLPVSPD